MMVLTDPAGYSIRLCDCEVPYLGARKAGTPCCCEVCGFMTPTQWAALATAVLRGEGIPT